jgi:hypothetical protein
MNIPTTLKCTCGIALGVFLLTNAFHFLNAYAKPEVSISPSCGPKSGFGVFMKAKGFETDSMVSWKLVDSDGNAPLTGYFHTDGKGDVNDQTTIADVKKGHYKLYFGDDKNSDGELDSEISQSDITIPCENK